MSRKAEVESRIQSSTEGNGSRRRIKTFLKRLLPGTTDSTKMVQLPSTIVGSTEEKQILSELRQITQPSSVDTQDMYSVTSSSMIEVENQTKERKQGKKIIFFSIPAHGHTNPTLSVARRLSELGNEVIYFSTEEFREKIEAAGVQFRSYSPDIPDAKMSVSSVVLGRWMLEAAEKEIPTLLEVVKQEKPDGIVHDTIAFWGKIIARESNTPGVSLLTTFARNKETSREFRRLHFSALADLIHHGYSTLKVMQVHKRLFQRYNLREKLSDLAVNKEPLNIVFTSRDFQPCADSFDESFKFVGPSMYPREEVQDFLQELDPKKKLIYISFGTIHNDNLSYFRECINAFKDTDYQVILSLGHRFSPNDLPQPIPTNFIVQNYVPQLAVLQRADVFISHGGMNSINESLYNGVPLIVIPQVNEEELNGTRVQQLKAGKLLKKEKISKERLQSAVEEILQSNKYRANASAIGITLKNAGGYERAAEEISTYLAG